MPNRDIIVIGSSAGGVEALQAIVGGLPSDLPAAVLIAAHRGAESPNMLPAILDRAGPLKSVMPRNGTPIEPRAIYIAPPDHHMLVKGRALALSKGPKENRSRPAIDPLFRSAAAAFGPRVIGVVLSGMLDDGTAGLYAIKEAGGASVIQDPKDALHPSMPANAIKYVGADFVLPEPSRAARAQAASPHNEIETRFAEMGETSMEDMAQLGSPAGLSCPECNGPMWKIEQGPVARYRCHVGHAYSQGSMDASQLEVLETHLWEALRLFKERAALLRERQAPTQGTQDEAGKAAFEAAMSRLQKNVETIREMLRQEASN